MKYYIGIDLGGTNIACGIVNEEYKILSKASTRTNLPRPAIEIANDMVKVALEACENADISINQIECIGIGTPGIADNTHGVIEYSNNLGFKNTPMAKYIQEQISKPVYLSNDANAAAYGEYLAGGAVGAENAVCITLGTGVGGGIVINGKIYAGSNLAGGELGHMVISSDGPLCTCGRKGCFEVFSSATGLIRMTTEAMEADKTSLMWQWSEQNGGKVSGRTVFECMKKGDPTAKRVVDSYIKYLACGVTNIINIFQPDILCIGGGICNEGDGLLNPLREQVCQEVYSKNSAKNTEITIAKLGNDAGIVGAAFLPLGLSV
jgi:glucokinase